MGQGIRTVLELDSVARAPHPPSGQAATTPAPPSAVTTTATVSRSQCPLPKHRKKKHFTRRRRRRRRRHRSAQSAAASTAAGALSPLLLPPYSAPHSLAPPTSLAVFPTAAVALSLASASLHVPSFLLSFGRPTRVQSLTAAAAAAACPFVCPM